MVSLPVAWWLAPGGTRACPLPKLPAYRVQRCVLLGTCVRCHDGQVETAKMRCRTQPVNAVACTRLGDGTPIAITGAGPFGPYPGR